MLLKHGLLLNILNKKGHYTKWDWKTMDAYKKNMQYDRNEIILHKKLYDIAIGHRTAFYNE